LDGCGGTGLVGRLSIGTNDGLGFKGILCGVGGLLGL